MEQGGWTTVTKKQRPVRPKQDDGDVRKSQGRRPTCETRQNSNGSSRSRRSNRSNRSSNRSNRRNNHGQGAYVPKHKRDRPINRQQAFQSKDIIKPVPLITAESFPTLGTESKKIPTPNVWAQRMERPITPESNEQVVWVQPQPPAPPAEPKPAPRTPKNSMFPELVFKSLTPETEDDDVIFCPLVIPRRPIDDRPRIEYDHHKDEYYFPTEPIDYEEEEYQSILAQELEESMRPLEDEELFIFLSSVNCGECMDTEGLEPEDMHQVCPLGFQTCVENGEDHRFCYMCTNCLLKQYAEYKLDMTEYFYRTPCGHILDIAEYKAMIKELQESVGDNHHKAYKQRVRGSFFDK